MLHNIKYILFYGLYIISFQLYAQYNTEIIIKDLPYKIKINENKPLQVIFGDERVAELKTKTLAQEIYEVPIKVVESGCSQEKIKNSCVLRFGLQSLHLDLVWVNNILNPERVGQKVKKYFSRDYDKEGNLKEIDIDSIQESEFFDLYHTPFIYRSELKNLFPNALKYISSYELVCDDFSWLKNNQKNAPQKMDLLTWTVEEMDTNTETGVNENQTVGTAIGMTFTKNSQHSLKLSKTIQFSRDVFGSSIFIIAGDIIVMTIKNSKDICQVSFKPDIGQLESVFTQAEKKLEHKPYEEIIYKENGHLGKLLANGFIQYPNINAKLDNTHKILGYLNLLYFKVTGGVSAQPVIIEKVFIK